MSDRQLMKCGCVAQAVRTSEGGVTIDPPIPVCITHDCTEVAPERPSLDGRVARCSYSHDRPSRQQRIAASPVPSSWDLAFFEYCGPGSREATEICKCGMAQIAHERNAGRCPHSRRSPSGKFEAKGDQGHDRFYCGCFGWD